MTDMNQEIYRAVMQYVEVGQEIEHLNAEINEFSKTGAIGELRKSCVAKRKEQSALLDDVKRLYKLSKESDFSKTSFEAPEAERGGDDVPPAPARKRKA